MNRALFFLLMSGGSKTTLGAVAGNRFQAPTAFSSIAANFTSRREHTTPAAGVCRNFRCIDQGWYIDNTFAIVNGSARTIKRYIEYPAGVFWPVTWASATSKAIVGSNGQITSDVVAGLTIPANTKYWERTVNLGSTSATFPVIELPAASTTLGVDDGNDVTDKGNSGTVSPTGGINTFGSSVILCDITGPAAARSVLMIGDSLAFGQADITTVGARNSSGFLDRALDIKGYGHFKMAKPGISASDVAGWTGTPLTQVQALFNAITPGNEILDELGVNDLRLGRTQGQLLADKQTYYTALCGTQPIRQTTLTPRSTSTDAWATVANQTVQSDGNWAALASVNAAIRAGLSGSAGYIEAADAAMSARDSGKHAAPPAGTLDGTHFVSANAARIAALIAPLYP